MPAATENASAPATQPTLRAANRIRRAYLNRATLAWGGESDQRMRAGSVIAMSTLAHGVAFAILADSMRHREVASDAQAIARGEPEAAAAAPAAAAAAAAESASASSTGRLSMRGPERGPTERGPALAPVDLLDRIAAGGDHPAVAPPAASGFLHDAPGGRGVIDDPI